MRLSLSVFFSGPCNAGVNSCGPAFDIVITDVFPSWFVGAPGSQVNSLSIPASSFNVTVSSMSLAIPVLLPGQTAQYLFDVVMSVSVGSANVVATTASGSFRSVPAIAGGFWRDYACTPGAVTLTVDAPAVAFFAATSTSDPDTSSAMVNPAYTDLGIGEAFNLTAVYVIPEGTNTVTIRILMPFVAAEVFFFKKKSKKKKIIEIIYF